jgi:hypothetical protein
MRVAPNYFRWLAKGAQEGAAQAVPTTKTRLGGDDVDRVLALLHISLAASTRRCSTAFAGDWPVSTRKARLNLRAKT